VTSLLPVLLDILLLQQQCQCQWAAGLGVSAAAVEQRWCADGAVQFCVSPGSRDDSIMMHAFPANHALLEWVVRRLAGSDVLL
jgi:hypothetical protein